MDSQINFADLSTGLTTPENELNDDYFNPQPLLSNKQGDGKHAKI